MACGSGPSTPARPPGLLKHRLDQIATAYDAAFYVLAALLFLRSYSRANTPLLRQQLKWVTRGTLLAVLPFTLFYAIPFLLRPAIRRACSPTWPACRWSFCRSPSVGPSSATG